VGAAVAGGITHFWFDPSVFRGIAAQNVSEDDWQWKPAGQHMYFGFDSARSRMRFYNAKAIDPMASVADVGWDGAARIVDQWLPWLPSTVARTPEYLNLTNPVTSQIFESDSLEVGHERTRGYAFSLFRSLNGVPVLNFENIAVISRTGALEYLQLTGDGDLEVDGKPGHEVPVGGSVVTTRQVTYDTLVTRFGVDFREKFGPTWTPKIQFSETVYLLDPGGRSISQYHLFAFVPGGPKESVGRLAFWAYTVSQASPVRYIVDDWKINFE